MQNGNDFFLRMCREAQDELAHGGKGWKEIETNTLILACFGMLSNHLAHKLAKPLWFFASCVASGILTYIIRSIIGG